MKLAKQILEDLQARGDFRIEQAYINGGFSRFAKGPFKGMTLFWTFDQGWEHVSIDGKKRYPTWEEMCEIKDIFWKPEEEAVQYFPKKSEYVNVAQYCLHIWRPIEQYKGKLATPPMSLA